MNLTINKNLTIRAKRLQENVIIDTQRLSRIFTIDNNINFTFINIKFLNGYISSQNGGAIYNSYATSKMTFINCTFFNNTAYSGGYNVNGAGIYNNGKLTIVGSNFTNNIAGVDGGAFVRGSTLILINSTFSNNIGNNMVGGLYIC